MQPPWAHKLLKPSVMVAGLIPDSPVFRAEHGGLDQPWFTVTQVPYRAGVTDKRHVESSLKTSRESRECFLETLEESCTSNCKIVIYYIIVISHMYKGIS